MFKKESTLGIVNLQTGFLKTITIDKNTIEDYEIMDETHSKSAVSAVGRGLVGGFLLGPVGLLAGLSAKSKGVHICSSVQGWKEEFNRDRRKNLQSFFEELFLEKVHSVKEPL
ncbi:hypothetical protein [Paenibacillus etheri]|uniref:hypothetical protein n=1 Tax=Paenibacillus etheri TaxID=1306852 RepID=UPI001FD85F1C|nr:hypothetical protein [Paenibacillus etheri]